MNINDDIYIWVTEVLDDIFGLKIFDGCIFDGDYGFGVNDVREFTGTLHLLYGIEKVEIYGSVSLMHVSRRGVLWLFDGGELPIPPFLITTNKKINNIKQSSVSLILTQESQEIFARNVDGLYPVISENFMGILYNSNNENFLIWFDEGNGGDFNSKRLIFSEWDVEVGIASVK